MIAIRDIRNAIVKGLYEHTQLTPIPVESIREKEPYPYITYNFISPYIAFQGQGNYSRKLVPSTDEDFEHDIEEIVTVQPTATISINCYSNNRKENGYDGKMEALELAKKCMEWLKHSGHQFLSDNNIVVVSVEAFGDRTSLIVDEYEARIGFDVIIRFTDVIKRRYEAIEDLKINTDIK